MIRLITRKLKELANKYGLLSVMRETNAKVFKQIFEHYCDESMLILDCTCGERRFYQKIDISKFNIIFSDIRRLGNICMDYNNLAIRSNIFDVIIFDPPFVNVLGFAKSLKSTGAVYKDNTYNLTNKSRFNFENFVLIDKEFSRILKRSGILIMKIQDNKNGFALVNIEKLKHFNLIDIIIYVFPDIPAWAKMIKKCGKKFKKSIRTHAYFLILRKR